MLAGHGSRRAPRPVDPALAATLRSSAEEIAKRWLVELVERTPLAATRGSQIQEISHTGPALIAAVADALGDDGALSRLEQRSAAARAEGDVASTLRSLDALQAALWEAALEQLRLAHPRDVVELAERLALTIEVLRRGELAAGGAKSPAQDASGPGEPGSGGGCPGGEAPRAADEHVLLAARLRRAAEGPPPPAERPAAPEPPRGLGEELAEEERGLSFDARRAEADAERAAASGSVQALEEEIRRARLSGVGIALILVELEDLERLQAGASARQLEELSDRFLETFRPLLRTEDILRLEGSGKAWIISPGTGRFTARLMAGGVIDELARSECWQGAPIRASAGIAVLDEDGSDAATLVDAAEQERFAASARGVALVEPEPL